MREIKLRAWDIEANDWAYGTLNIKRFRFDIKCDIYGQLVEGYGIDGLIKEETMSEYTGYKDINDVEIYEGDIVEIVDGPTLHPDNCYIGTKFKVFYNQESCSFMMQDIYDEDNTQYFDLDLGGIPPKYLEVIGNIYENKELLEVE